MRSWRWSLATVVCCLVLSASQQPHTITLEEPVEEWQLEDEGRVCGNIDVRNTVSDLEKLRGCRIVEGYVQIVLIDKAAPQNYNNFTFPELREITGYLLLYRVSGLKTLGHLFPNLCVIRGNRLIVNYSLVVFEMFHMENLGLRSLTDIVRGAVRIESNPELCYLDTVDWASISASGSEHFIQGNRDVSQCPGCTDCVTGLCWSEQRCQQTERPVCHRQCLGGCRGLGPHHCYACRSMRLHGECVEKCPAGRFPYLGLHCITEKQCQVMENRNTIGCHRRHQDWPFEKFCVQRCPVPHTISIVRGPDGQMEACEECQKQCPCKGRNIDGIQAAQQMKGCTLIHGSLLIEVQGGKDIVKELEENLGMIEEISGILTVTRSVPLKSLSFLKNLRIIHGIPEDDLMPPNHSLVVYNNRNLKELWDWNTKPNDFKIKNGRLFFHDNPKLCISEIEKLNNIAALGNFTNYEVSHQSNGDKASCNHTNYIDIVVSVIKMHTKSALLEWTPLKVEDKALRYMVYYIKAPFQNVSTYDDDMCGDNDNDFWSIKYVEIPFEDNIVHPITRLEPNTQYAYYVTLVTMSTYIVGKSSIKYFTTLPDRPSVPQITKTVSNKYSEIEIQWKAPKNINGVLKYYVVSGILLSDEEEYFDQRNYCTQRMTKTDIQPPPESIKTAFTCIDKKSDCCNTENVYSEIENEPDQDVCEQDTGFLSADSESGTWENHVFNFLHTNYIEDEVTRQMRLKELRKINEMPYTWDFEEHLDLNKHGRQHKKFTQKVPANTTRLVVKNVIHYSHYSVKVKACREPQPNDLTQCSFASLASIRSLAKDDADMIDSDQVHVYTWNHTVGYIRIDWPKPKNPNGIIVSYHAEYLRLDVENSKPLEECLTREEHESGGMGYLMKNLLPGKYSFRIRATSLAGEGPFTKRIEYEVLEPLKTLSPGEAIAIVIGSLLAVSALIILLICCQRRRENNLWLIASVNPDYMNASMYMEDEWELERDNIEFDKELGKGSFGIVYEGVLKPDNIPCAIKTVSDNSTPRECAEFLNEASVMKAFSDAHYVVRLLGVVSRGQPPLVIMELMATGDLKSFLRASREGSDRPDLHQLLTMAAQIADGMAYLEMKKFVHRDLAARNCMVGGDLTVKVGDFGMTRDIYETDYYRNGSQGLLPVRWMAPESLADGVFTSQSDVWSYGVVLWEMATLAEQPYQGLANEQVMLLVLGGGVLERSADCPDILHQLMGACWGWRPESRPTFLQLVERVDGIIDLGLQFQLSSYYYMQEHSPIDAPPDPDAAHWTSTFTRSSPTPQQSLQSIPLQRLPPPPKKIHSSSRGSGDGS